jgi:hypothetical protein
MTLTGKDLGTTFIWIIWFGIFDLRSLSWDLEAWGLWLGISSMGSLPLNIQLWDLWLGVFGLGSLSWDP